MNESLYKFILDENGCFEVNYFYDEAYLDKASPYTEVTWAYEYFRYYLESGYIREKIDKYIEDKKNGLKK